MKFRKMTGEERERLLGSRKPTGFNYAPYLEAINEAGDGDGIAVEINGSSPRGEKNRFARAAGRVNKSLRWLPNPTENEIAFTVTSKTGRRWRGRPQKALTEDAR